jgi:SAM-dependent methyltransferase
MKTVILAGGPGTPLAEETERRSKPKVEVGEARDLPAQGYCTSAIQTTCRTCAATGLQTVLALGRTPLANALRDAADRHLPEPTYPLDLALCSHCSLLQIMETVAPRALFDEYCYFSSFSDTMLRHAAGLAERLCRERKLDSSSLVLEAASNDGYLLRWYRQAGVRVLGIDPARNIAEVARAQHGIPTWEAYFSSALASELAAAGFRAAVFHAHNVLGHVPDLADFLRGIRTVLRDDGIAVIEVPYVKDLLDRCAFDTIYHEHLSYFSLTALEHCFRRQGLLIQDVERLDIHGGSLRLFAVPAGGACERKPAVQALLAEEASWDVATLAPYLNFARRVAELRRRLRELLERLKGQGKRLAAYGASAKGCTLLHYCAIGRETLDFVVDRNPVKQGRYTPGTHLLVRCPEALLEEQPDYTLLLTWNFADEILNQQAEYRRRGGRFIVPVPEPSVA